MVTVGGGNLRDNEGLNICSVANPVALRKLCHFQHCNHAHVDGWNICIAQLEWSKHCWHGLFLRISDTIVIS